MIRLALRNIRRHFIVVAGGALALAITTTLTVSLLLVAHSAAGHRPPVERYAAADLVVAPVSPLVSGGVPEALVQRLSRIPGVRAVPELSFPVTVPGGTPGPVFGHAWDSAPLTPFSITSGTPPATGDEVVLDRRLAHALGVGPGDAVTVAVSGATGAYRISGVAEGRLVQQSAVFFAAGEAARLAGYAGRYDAVGILSSAAGDVRASVEHVLREWEGRPSLGLMHVYEGADRSAVEGVLIDDDAYAVILGTVALWLGAVITWVAATLTFRAFVRRRAVDLGLLTAVGATRRQLFTFVIIQSFLVALLALAAGAAAGTALAAPLAEVLRRAGVLSDGVVPVLDGGPLLLGTGATAAAMTVAALGAAWSARRVGERTVARAGRFVDVEADDETHAAAAGWGRLRREPAVKAVGAVLGRHTRAAAPLLAALLLIGFMVGVEDGGHRQAAEAAARQLAADHVVEHESGRLDQAVLAELAGEATSMARVRFMEAVAGPEGTGRDKEYVQIVSGDAAGLLRPPLTGGDLTALGPSSAIVEAAYGRAHGLEVGSRLTLRFPGESRDTVLTVRALHHGSHLLFGRIIIGAAAAPAAGGGATDERLYVAGVDRAGLGAAVSRLADRDPQVTVVDRAGIPAALLEQARGRSAGIYALTSLLAFLLAAASVNSAALTLFVRSPHPAAAPGEHRADPHRLSVWQFGPLLAAALVTAVTAAVLAVASLSAAMLRTIAVPWDGILALLAGVLIVMAAVAALCSRKAVRDSRRAHALPLRPTMPKSFAAGGNR